jgi:hypothetical protein
MAVRQARRCAILARQEIRLPRRMSTLGLKNESGFVVQGRSEQEQQWQFFVEKRGAPHQAFEVAPPHIEP